MSTPYPSAPGEPDPYAQQGPALTEPPASVRSAMMVIWALVAFQVIGTVLRLVSPDTFRPLRSEQAEQQVDPAAAGAAGVVLGLVLIGLFVFFALSFRKGKKWARITLLVLAILILALNLFGLLAVLVAGVTALSLVMTVIQLVLLAALIYYLVKPDTAAWCQR